MFVQSKAKTQEHGTPLEIFRGCLEAYGPFDLDPAADHDIHLCRRYYTWEGLRRPWCGRVFVNPPYTRIGEWIAKAHEEAKAGRASIVVMLAKVDTSAGWFHRHVLGVAEIIWLPGRVRYLKRVWETSPRSGAAISVGFEPGQSAPFASALFIWRASREERWISSNRSEI